VAWFDYLLSSFAIVFFFDYIIRMFGRRPFCKTEGTRISSLRVYLVVIVISRLSNLVGKDRLYSIGYAEIELDYTRESV
jgi:hypothetical protein